VFVGSLLVVAALLGLVLRLAVGWWAFVITIGLAAVIAWSADRRAAPVVLRTIGSRPVSPAEEPRLHNVVEGLCATLGLRPPAVELLDHPAVNALAVGRSPGHTTLVVTRGLVDGLGRIELEGVVARLLVAAKQHDVQLGTLVSATVLAPVLLAERAAERPGGALGRLLGIPGSLLGPPGASLAAKVLPPRRDVLLDLAAAAVTRYPPGLITALDRCGGDAATIPQAPRSSAHLWMIDPRPAVGPTAIDRSAPAPVDERIATLREL